MDRWGGRDGEECPPGRFEGNRRAGRGRRAPDAPAFDARRVSASSRTWRGSGVPRSVGGSATIAPVIRLLALLVLASPPIDNAVLPADADAGAAGEEMTSSRPLQLKLDAGWAFFRKTDEDEDRIFSGRLPYELSAYLGFPRRLMPRATPFYGFGVSASVIGAHYYQLSVGPTANVGFVFSGRDVGFLDLSVTPVLGRRLTEGAGGRPTRIAGIGGGGRIGIGVALPYLFALRCPNHVEVLYEHYVDSDYGPRRSWIARIGIGGIGRP